MKTNGQKGMTRPYAVRIRRESISYPGTWQGWRTHATYATEERAQKAAERERRRWVARGYAVEVHVRRAELRSDKDREAAGAENDAAARLIAEKLVELQDQPGPRACFHDERGVPMVRLEDAATVARAYLEGKDNA